MTSEDQGTTAVEEVEPELPRDNVVPGAFGGKGVDLDNATDANGDPTLNPPMAGPEGIETTNRFECASCGVVNNPPESRDTCGACGAVQPTPEEPTAPPVEALVEAMKGALGDPQAIENIERQANGLKPLPGRLPLRGVGKAFDWTAAFEDLHHISLEVAAREREHDELKKRTKSAKDGLDDAQARLRSMFDHYYENKTTADDAPGLPFEGDVSGCPIERESGAPCPACQSQRAKGGDADTNDPLHPAHPQHADVARSLLVKDMDHLGNLLLGKHFYVKSEELAGLPVSDLMTLQRYAAQRGKVPPPLLARAHIAAEAGTDRQQCKRCDLILTDQTNLDEGDVFYPALAAVGLDCPGSVAEHDAKVDEMQAAAMPATETPEPARYPARGKKKTANKKTRK